MGYYVNLSLKRHRHYVRLKLKIYFLYSKFECLILTFHNHMFIIPVPVDIQVHIVPHLKALTFTKFGVSKGYDLVDICCISESPENRQFTM